MDEDSILDFNFWPSFSDLMLALVLVLCLVLFLVLTLISAGTVNLDQVKNNQRSMINQIAKTYNVEAQVIDDRTFGISSDGTDRYDIRIENDLNRQRITFSHNVLFQKDKTDINEKGQQILTVVGQKLQTQLGSIKEIQIQGHADTNPTSYVLNTRLAAERAISVFEFFRKTVGIDPSQHLLSATSFGEYRPVGRSEGDSSFNWEKVLSENATDSQRSQNRRIELVLIYRQ
jgi:flagellar motor protein MotB